MATMRSQIVSAVRLALAGPGKPTGLVVVGRSAPPGEDDDLPRIAVTRSREEITKHHDRYPVVERMLYLRIDCWESADDATQEAEDALEPILAWVTSTMLTDPSWGKLAIDTREASIEWESSEAEHSYAKATAEYTIRYTTKTNNSEVKQ